MEDFTSRQDFNFPIHSELQERGWNLWPINSVKYCGGPIYRVIIKSLCTWWLQYRKLQVMFKVSPATLQTFIDTLNCVLKAVYSIAQSTFRMYSVIAIFNSSIVWGCSNTLSLYSNRQVHRNIFIILYLILYSLDRQKSQILWPQFYLIVSSKDGEDKPLNSKPNCCNNSFYRRLY